MFQCGPKRFSYDPFTQYCKSNGYVADCDQSMCFIGKTEWDRQACGLYCGDIKINSDSTVLIWQIGSGVLMFIVVVLCLVIVYLCLKNRKKKSNPATESMASSDPQISKDKEETCVLLENGSNERSPSDDDSAVGSDASQTTGNGSPSHSLISPQNNHDDPHTQRNDRTGLAVTGIAQDFGAPC